LINNDFPMVIGIAGGTGSGKTTIANKIVAQFDSQDIVIILQDAYYKDRSHLPEKEREKINYDHPSAFDADLLIQHLLSLKNNESIKRPVYDFFTHTRKTETITIQPTKIVILEGIMIFDNPQLRDVMDIKIFVDTDSDVRFIRRLQRDINERGRNLESVINQYLETVKPMHLEFVEKSKRYADIIIPEGGYNQKAIDVIVSQIRLKLNENSRISNSIKSIS